MTEHFDVLIVGAGISGLGAACHLQERCPGKSFVLLEAQETFGGTWWTHRYPGVRSDSDLFTFGYRFKPWNGAPLASGAEILAYLNEVIDEHGLSGSIRYRHCVESAAWSTEDRRWRLTVRRVDTGEELRFTAGFLWMCQGYYRHDRPHTPAWAGLDRYQGTVVHPQHWPDGLDYGGKRVVVIGSGATAATLIPALAAGAGHVTMLQRSPTFFLPQPNVEELAETLRDLDVPDEWTHEILRRRHIKELTTLARMSAESPDALRKYLLEEIRSLLPEGFDVERHFTPSYRPWQQRIAVVPDGDLFAAIREGRVSVVTDRIDHFTPTGIRLASGEEVEADIVVTATGFDLSVLGDLPVVVDGRQVDFAEAVTYLGIMFTGVPNLASVFGYFRFSWTLRADLVSEFVCRLLRHMDDRGAGVVVPRLRPGEGDMPLGPWFDPEDFNPGYVMRSLDRLPRQGDRLPWRLGQDYLVERDLFPAVDLDDGALAFA